VLSWVELKWLLYVPFLDSEVGSLRNLL